MCKPARGRIILSMSPIDYITDSALVLLVILQLKERVLTNQALLRPILILGVAVFSYFKTFPMAGNDLPLILAISGIGAILGVLSGVSVMMHTNPEGRVTAKAGAASAIFWVLGMGSRFAFAVWAASASGAASLATFSGQHHITSAEAFTVALLGMAVCEVLGRTLVLVARRSQLQSSRPQVVLA
jgi:hypothetical protein